MARRRKRSKYTFGSAPLIYHSRSQFDLSFSHKTSFSAGKLIPVYLQEVLPGDTFTCKSAVVARVTSSFLKPVMDNAFLDLFFFFVPNRLVYNKWEQIFGENTQGPWAQTEAVSTPLITDSSFMGSADYVGTLADYFGIPPEVPALGDFGAQIGGISVLPFRAYAKIWDDWFRDENLQDPMNIQLGDIGISEILNDKVDVWAPDNYTGVPAPVSKTHDYFTQVLPAPQKGSPVEIAVSVFPAMSAPVVTSTSITTATSGFPLQWSIASSGGLLTSADLGVNSQGDTAGFTVPSGTGISAMPRNLVADIPETSLNAVDVNDLRYAFQLQKMLERDARSGSRYREYLQSAFGVVSPDSRLQVSEFLGGKRIPLSIFQTVQTSEATTQSPLGNVAAFSLSNGTARWSKSFVEHGFVIGVACVRQYHSYQQGVDRFWFRSNRTDYYDTIFANIGEQPVWTKQLYVVDGVGADTVFGYNPAWEEYRTHMNSVSGQLRTTSGTGLDIWHFADSYSSQPVLGSDWIHETPANIDRALSVPSTTVDQFIFDFYFNQKAVRAMPTYSVPGFIDHH